MGSTNTRTFQKKGFKTVDVPSWTEVLRCWKYAKRLYSRQKLSLKKLLLLGFVFFSGRRLGEIRHLKVGDVNLKEEVYRFKSEKKQKSEREDVYRFAPIPTILIPYLKTYLSDKTNPDHWLFPADNYPNLPFPESTARVLVYKITKKAIGKRIRPHAFRHAVAIRLVSKRVPMEYIRRVLAHSSYEPTKWYLDITVQDIKTEFNQALFEEEI